MLIVNNKKFVILSIDGGGLRGVIPLKIISEIERMSNKEIHRSFDLIAGTSTGGILACALCLRDADSPIGDKRKFTIPELENIYRKDGKTIFPYPKNKLVLIIRFLRNIVRPKFRKENIEQVLKSYFGTNRIRSCLRPIYISTYDIYSNKPLTFTYREAHTERNKNPLLVDIGRSTSAAPTYLSSHSFNHHDQHVTCIDGGIYMNNPALGALVEVLGNRDFKHYQLNSEILSIDDIFVLSLGTGRVNQLINSQNTHKWGLARWVKPVVDLMMNGPVKAVDQQISTIFNSYGLSENYLRLNVDIEKTFSEMSDSKDITMDYWIEQVNSQIIHNESEMNRLERFLKKSGIIQKQ